MGWMVSGGREEARRIAPVLQLAFLVILPHFVHPDFALTLGLVICKRGSTPRVVVRGGVDAMGVGEVCWR